jgi:nitrate reductase NapE component
VTTVLVLVILALIWAAVLVPPYLQNRRETRPGDSIASFRNQLNVLERTTPGSSRSNLSRLDVGRYDAPSYNARSNVAQLAGRSSAPSPAALRRAEARRRRRDVFVFLLGAVGVTFILAVAMGGPVWMLHLAVDVVFVAYVGLLVSMQAQTSEREVKVRYMPQTTRRAEPQLALRRYGS